MPRKGRMSLSPEVKFLSSTRNRNNFKIIGSVGALDHRYLRDPIPIIAEELRATPGKGSGVIVTPEVGQTPA